jgi:type IV pilus assembly protein PilP
LKRMNQPRLFPAIVAVPLVTLVIAAAACGGDEGAGTAPPPPAAGPVPVGAKPASPAAAAAAPASSGAAAIGPDGGVLGATAKLPALPLREFQERDFSETDQSRDPFRSFVQVFVQQAAAHSVLQRKVLVDRYALDELRLVGLVLGAPSRALLTDPSGLGWVAKVGDFVGKSELVHAGGPTGTDVAVNWRVDRIRDGDIVFIREDPSHPEIPPTTRVVSLRTPEEEAGQKGPNR